jgi:hypothetical protein
MRKVRRAASVTLAIAVPLAGGCAAEEHPEMACSQPPALALVLPVRGCTSLPGDERCRLDESLGLHREREAVPQTRIDVRTVDRRRTSDGRVHEHSSTTTRIRSTSGF